MTTEPSPNVSYRCNPDVVLREEDEDGGLLFNPDTSQVKILNPTGLCIWKQCASPADAHSIAAALRTAFEEVPEQELMADIAEFLEGMLQSGFIGVVESN